jgi:hypothetical protein
VVTGQNPAHHDIRVSDIHEGIALVERHGGKTNGRLGEDDAQRIGRITALRP